MSVPVEANETIEIRTTSNTLHDEEQQSLKLNKQFITEKSKYFRMMCLSNPNVSCFYVKCEAKILSMAIDVLKGKDLATTVKDLDILLSLEATTEIFQMDELKEECMQLMAKSVNFRTVWKIYDTNQAPVIENCEWLLKTRTKDLLTHPDFVDIKPETLARFLRLEEMNIESETVLLEAILRFTRTGKHGSNKDVFRKYALPHLRVHNLQKSDCNTLHSFLTSEEFLLVSYLMDFSDTPVNLRTDILCLESRPRRSENSRVLVIEPDNDIYDSADLVWNGPKATYIAEQNKFVLSFVTMRRIMLQRIFFFCPLLVGTPRTEQFDMNVQQLKEPGGCPLPSYMMASSLKIFSPSQGERVSEIKSSNMFLNKIAFMKLNVEVPEEAQVSIEIEFSNYYYYHQIAKSMATVFESSDPSIQEVLGNVTLRHLRDGQEKKEEFIPTVFKSVHMNVI